jgi:hypothetical protein
VLALLAIFVTARAFRSASVDDGDRVLAVGLLVMAVVGLLVGSVRPRGHRVPAAVLASVVSLPLLLGGASLVRAGDVRDAQAAPTAAARRQLSLVTRIADRMPDDAQQVDLRWSEDAPLGEMPQLLADALAQRGFDVRLPKFSTPQFGPELTGLRDPANPAIWLRTAGDVPPRHAIRIGSWQDLVAYRVPPSR